MALADRLSYALIGCMLGALLGGLCWWLYGLAHSLRFDGPGIDPALLDWVKYGAGMFAALGFVLRGKLGDALGYALGAVFRFESEHDPDARTSPWVSVLLLAMLGVALWYAMR